MIMETEVLTLEEVGAVISAGLSDYQKETNLTWLRGIHASLNEGCIWSSPALGTVYSRRGDGFVLEMALIGIPANRTEH